MRTLSSLFLALTLSGCSAAPSPEDLLAVAQKWPDPFQTHNPPNKRLFGVAATEATRWLAACDRADWRPTGVRHQEHFAKGTGLTHDFECRRGSNVVMAEVIVDPWLGAEGVTFAACTTATCPRPEEAFRYGGTPGT